jgi:hypothetical protein
VHHRGIHRKAAAPDDGWLNLGLTILRSTGSVFPKDQKGGSTVGCLSTQQVMSGIAFDKQGWPTWWFPFSDELVLCKWCEVAPVIWSLFLLYVSSWSLTTCLQVSHSMSMSDVMLQQDLGPESKRIGSKEYIRIPWFKIAKTREYQIGGRLPARFKSHDLVSIWFFIRRKSWTPASSIIMLVELIELRAPSRLTRIHQPWI